jgi:hypothetical protein
LGGSHYGCAPKITLLIAHVSVLSETLSMLLLYLDVVAKREANYASQKAS